MRMIQAECSIIYDGRGHTELGRGIRTIPIKDDDTVIIHGKNGVKPANYMGTVGGIDADIDREGTERRRQEWVSRNFTVFGESMMFAQREFQTGDGAIDLLGMDSSANGAVFVEVKRNADEQF